MVNTTLSDHGLNPAELVYTINADDG